MTEQEYTDALRDSAERFLADQCPNEVVHRHIDGGEPFLQSLWKQFAELGLLMIAAPERCGGMGGGAVELAILQQALGAHAAPLPFLGTALLTHALSKWPDHALADGYLPSLASGDAIGGTVDFALSRDLRLVRTGDGPSITGAAYAIDAVGASLLLVRFDDEHGQPGLAVLPIDTGGIEISTSPVGDLTRSVGKVIFQRTPVTLNQCVTGNNAKPVIDAVSDLAMVMLAADALGGAEKMLADLVEYLKVRVQFGKPIGSFQALKHRAAELKTSLEMSRGLVVEATVRLARGEATPWAAMAKASMCETYLQVCSEAVQMHGGIGFTWEHHAHLFLKRASLDRCLFGSTAVLQDSIASSLIENVA